jgi:hypothetical protein
MRLFDALPNVLLFERFLFVHGGIPRDSLVKERYRDLSSLNDPDRASRCCGGDPSLADVIPRPCRTSPRGSRSGRLQALAFLQRLGCHTLVRGHEKVNEGFRRVYDDDHQLVISLFSAGGEHNDDLPADSSYRSVTPMAMTLRFHGGRARSCPGASSTRRSTTRAGTRSSAASLRSSTAWADPRRGRRAPVERPAPGRASRPRPCTDRLTDP